MRTIATERFYEQDSPEHLNNNMIEVCINKGINTIPAGFYAGRSNIVSVIISDGVKKIYGNVFSYCSDLISISMPDSIIYIGPRAFARCEKLESITIPQYVEELGNSPFLCCRNLSSVSFLAKKMVNGIFRGCRNISSIYIGENVQEIDPDIFIGCKRIKSIVVDANNMWFDSRDNCNAIIEKKCDTLILGCNTSKVPKGVKHISDRAFEDCGRMRNITLPDGLESIGSLPNSIQKIFIPKGTKDKFRQLLPRKKSKLIEH